MPTNMIWKNDAETQYVDPADWKKSTKEYRIHLLVTKDEENCYSAVALNLPGAGSCGSTEEEAISNAKEAIREVLKEYKTSGTTIPWKNTCSDDIPAGSTYKWIIVDA